MSELNQKSDNQGTASPVILLTDTNRWALTARVAIAFSDTGCEVAAVCPAKGHPLQKTKAVRQTFPYSGIRPIESLIAAIEATQPQLVVACDDRSVEHLHELYARASSMGPRGQSLRALLERSLGPPTSYPVVSARYELLRVAGEEGIRVPDTREIHRADDLRQWEQGHPFPWVLKADGTFGGRGVKIVHTRQKAVQSFEELTKQFGLGRVLKRLCVNRDSFWTRPWWKGTRPAISVQAHIEGNPASCAVVAWEGRVLASIAVKVVRCDGETGPASVVRVAENSEMRSAAEKIARRLHLSGFFGLDFVIENGTSAPYLIEMNPRCAPPCHIQLGEGHDLMGAITAELSGDPFRAKPPATSNEMIAYFPQAWTSQNEFLDTSFQDIPSDEPELMQELLRPWPDRTFAFRAANYLSQLKRSAAALLTGSSAALSRSKV